MFDDQLALSPSLPVLSKDSMMMVMRREAFWFVVKWVSAIFLIPIVQASIQKTRTSLCFLSEFCWWL
jgi:hypothetical protein